MGIVDVREVVGKPDIEAVAALARSIWNEHYVPIIGQAQVDYMLERFQSAAAISGQIGSGYRYFLAGRGGRDIGYLAVCSDAAGGSMILSKIYVVAGSRRSGVGRALLERAEALCRQSGLSRLWLTVNRHNAKSIAAYERMGFRNVGVLVTDIGGGFVMDDYRMEKEIRA